MSRVDDWVEARAETITVHSPEKTGSFTSYEVAHITASSAVRRRYSDFLQLRHSLTSHFPGAFIPPLPHKRAMGRFELEFVATRQRGLQHFLEEILKSPDFHELDYVIAFWEKPDVNEWMSLARVKESPPRVGWMKRTMNNMQVSKQVLQNYSDVVENDSTIADIEETINDILSKNKRTEAVSVQLLTAVNKSKTTISLRAQAALKCHELDVKNCDREKAEGDTDVTTDDNIAFKMFAEAEDIIATRLKTHNSNVAAQFVEPIQRYSSSLESFQKSIVRQNMLKKEYVAKDIAFQKQKASESEVQSAQNNYHLGVQRVSRDYDRYRESRTQDVCSNLMNLCYLQVENCRMIGLAWQQLEQSLLNQKQVDGHFSSDRYNAVSYQSDRGKQYSGLVNKDMLADLTHYDEDDADCISV